MKTYSKVELMAPPLLISALDGGQWSVSHSGHFTTGEEFQSINWIGGLGWPQSPSGCYGEQNHIVFAGNETQSVQPVTIPTELSRLLSKRCILPKSENLISNIYIIIWPVKKSALVRGFEYPDTGHNDKSVYFISFIHNIFS